MIRAFAEALPELQAERQLLAAEAAAVPHMGEQDRRGFFDRQQRMLGREERPRRATLDDLRRLGINVTTVPVKRRPKRSG